MGYLYDATVDALGGKLLIGGSDVNYGNWSPNNIREVYLTPRGMVAVYHTPERGVYAKSFLFNGTKVMSDLNRGRWQNPLQAFEAKNFFCLELLVVDPVLKEGLQRFATNCVKPTSRIRKILMTQAELPGGESLTNAADVYNQLVKASEAEGTPPWQLSIESVLDGNGGVFQVCGKHVVASYDDSLGYIERFNLVPNVYAVDRAGGKLDEHFRSILRVMGGSGGEGSDESGDPLDLRRKKLSKVEREELNWTKRFIRNDINHPFLRGINWGEELSGENKSFWVTLIQESTMNTGSIGLALAELKAEGVEVPGWLIKVYSLVSDVKSLDVEAGKWKTSPCVTKWRTGNGSADGLEVLNNGREGLVRLYAPGKSMLKKWVEKCQKSGVLSPSPSYFKVKSMQGVCEGLNTALVKWKLMGGEERARLNKALGVALEHLVSDAKRAELVGRVESGGLREKLLEAGKKSSGKVPENLGVYTGLLWGEGPDGEWLKRLLESKASGTGLEIVRESLAKWRGRGTGKPWGEADKAVWRDAGRISFIKGLSLVEGLSDAEKAVISEAKSEEQLEEVIQKLLQLGTSGGSTEEGDTEVVPEEVPEEGVESGPLEPDGGPVEETEEEKEEDSGEDYAEVWDDEEMVETVGKVVKEWLPFEQELLNCINITREEGLENSEKILRQFKLDVSKEVGAPFDGSEAWQALARAADGKAVDQREYTYMWSYMSSSLEPEARVAWESYKASGQSSEGYHRVVGEARGAFKELTGVSLETAGSSEKEKFLEWAKEVDGVAESGYHDILGYFDDEFGAGAFMEVEKAMERWENARRSSAIKKAIKERYRINADLYDVLALRDPWKHWKKCEGVSGEVDILEDPKSFLRSLARESANLRNVGELAQFIELMNASDTVVSLASLSR